MDHLPGVEGFTMCGNFTEKGSLPHAGCENSLRMKGWTTEKASMEVVVLLCKGLNLSSIDRLTTEWWNLIFNLITQYGFTNRYS
jgi:hypothetical protein